MTTLYLTPDTAELTSYHFTFQGAAGEAGEAVAITVPLNVDAGSNTLVDEEIRRDKNFSVDVQCVAIDADILDATTPVLTQNALGVFTGFTFILNNNNNAEANFRLDVSIRHSYTR